MKTIDSENDSGNARDVSYDGLSGGARTDPATYVQDIWQQSADANKTRAVDYISVVRGSSLPFDGNLKILDQHRHSYWDKPQVCLIAALRSDPVGHLQAVEIEALPRLGDQFVTVSPKRVTYGAKAGCAWWPEDFEDRCREHGGFVVEVESVHKARAVMEATGLAAVATSGAAGLGKVQYPTYVRTIVVGADRGASEELSRTAAKSYASRGAISGLALPPEGLDDTGKPYDWDAALKNLGADAIRHAIETTEYYGPDLAILSPLTTAPPAPNLRNLGELGELLHRAAEIKNTPVDYVVGALLVVAASLIGNSRRVSPWPSWTEPPILWGVLVGAPSTSKSPAIDVVLEALAPYEQALYDTWRLRMDMYENSQGDGNQTGIVKPIYLRHRTGDATPEKLAELCATFPKGLLVYRDEVFGIFGSFGQYKQGADREFYLEGYGARSFVRDRMHLDEPVVVKYLGFSILGTAQPDKIRQNWFNGVEDGLPARVIYLFPAPVPMKRPRENFDTSVLAGIFNRLATLEFDEDGRPITIPFSEQATNVFEQWWLQHGTVVTQLDGLLAVAKGKHQGMVLRIALVIEVVVWASQSPLRKWSSDPEPPHKSQPEEISLESLNIAIELVDWSWSWSSPGLMDTF